MLICMYCGLERVDHIRYDDLVFCDEKCCNRYIVMNWFNHRCALNLAHRANTIHEIIPRSVRPNDWWDLDNMIPLCWRCHGKVHSEGTKKHRKGLQEILAKHAN